MAIVGKWDGKEQVPDTTPIYAHDLADKPLGLIPNDNIHYWTDEGFAGFEADGKLMLTPKGELRVLQEAIRYQLLEHDDVSAGVHASFGDHPVVTA